MKKITVLLFTIFSVTAFAGEQTGKVNILYARASDNLHLVSLTGGSERASVLLVQPITIGLLRMNNL